MTKNQRFFIKSLNNILRDPEIGAHDAFRHAGFRHPEFRPSDRGISVDHIVLGTDHPAGRASINPTAHIPSVPGLSEEDVEKVLGGTLKKLLKIEG